MLAWAEQVMRTRNQYAAKKRLRSIDPTPEMPGIVIVIDEAHELLIGYRTIRRLVEQLTQMGRKTAISLVLATQVASVSQLGGSNVIRSVIKSGTVIALRTDKGTSGFVTDTPPPEPLHRLPEQWPTTPPPKASPT